VTSIRAAGGSGTFAWFNVLVSDPVVATLVCLVVGLLVVVVGRYRSRDEPHD